MSAGKIRKVVITWAGWKELILSRARSDGFESLNIVALDDRQEILAAVRDADALVVGALDAQILDSAKQVMWIHAMAGGVGPYLFPEFVRSPVLFTCCKPCFGIVGAEYALGAMLLFSRRSHTAMGSPFLSQWMVAQDEVLSPFELSGKNVRHYRTGQYGPGSRSKSWLFGDIRSRNRPESTRGYGLGRTDFRFRGSVHSPEAIRLRGHRHPSHPRDPRVFR